MLISAFVLWRIVAAVIGAFGTAYLHERAGRDVTTGGMIGFIVGGIFGIVFLALFWMWLYYTSPSPIGRVYNLRRRWYKWWM